MKTMKIVFALILSGMLLQSCNNDRPNNGIKVDPAVEAAFNDKYPTAKEVRWSDRKSYYVAKFKVDNIPASAWFDKTAYWQMTKTDISYNELPQAVKATFEAGEYTGWRIDDVDRLEREGVETVYIIEVKNENTEYDLYYTADGIFIKAVLDLDDDDDYEGSLPTEIPSAIKQYLDANYPQARIVETDREKDGFEVEIIDGQVHRELLFSTSGAWIYTKTEIRNMEDIPAVVSQAFQNSEYSNFRIDDIDFYLTPRGDYYTYELESENQDVRINISTTGTIEWVYTKTEVSQAQVPDVVKQVLLASKYSFYRIEDIDLYETPADTFYYYELKKGNQEVELTISTTGEINVIKTSND